MASSSPESQPNRSGQMPGPVSPEMPRKMFIFSRAAAAPSNVGACQKTEIGKKLAFCQGPFT